MSKARLPVTEFGECYFDLPRHEQAALLHGLAPMLGRRAEILEKGIWLCQVLGLLFTLPNHKPMVFKGGTNGAERTPVAI